jgi:hypothetical protein
MVGHNDVRMKLVEAEGAVVQQCVDEELGYARDLEDRPPVLRRRGDIGHTGTRCWHSFRHGLIVRASRDLMNPTNGVLNLGREQRLL